MIILKKWFILLGVFFISNLSANQTSWDGEWHVFWKSGSFSLTLEQHGSDVNGSFNPENGKLRGKIIEDILHATTITENNITVQLSLTMSKSKTSFFGSFDNGEWLTGVREHTDKMFNHLSVDLTSPKSTLYSFLILGNSVRSGNYRALDKAMSILEFTKKQKKRTYANRLESTQVFFHILNECMINRLVFTNRDNKKHTSIELTQSGSDVKIPVNFIKEINTKQWKIKLPDEETLKHQLNALLKARGKYEIDPKANLKLKYPRATMRTLFEQYMHWEEGGKDFVLSTMNLSNINPAIREWQAPRLAYYLMSVLNRISYVVFQEIPNDPKSKKPYIHFHHPLGNIVIEPYEIEGEVKWQFTPKTLATIDKLYYEMDTVKSKISTKSIEENSLYFRLKKQARGVSPLLVHEIFYTEIWQIIMLLLIFLLALFITYLLQRIVMLNLPKHWDKELVNLEYLKPFQIVVFGMIFLYGSHQLGLPNTLFSLINIFSKLLIIIGLSWMSYNVIDIIFSILKKHAQKTSTDVDEIILSLIGSTLRIVVIIVASFMIADLFNIPYKTVLAGLGIGGLAFAIAAKDTIANFFGSAIIIADTPFKTGDKIKIGSDKGVVTNVGIRSTKIRTPEDTLLTIPNNKITHEVIDNYSAREAMRIDTEFFLDIKTPKVVLDKLDRDISLFLKENENIVPNKIILTGVNDYTDKGISFGVSFFTKATTVSEYSDIRHKLISEIAEIINKSDINLIVVEHRVLEDKK